VEIAREARKKWTKKRLARLNQGEFGLKRCSIVTKRPNLADGMVVANLNAGTL
jgi:hypothetical protein